MSHKVNRLIFELAGAPKKDSVELQNRMSLFAKNELIPALNVLFDELIPEDQTIYLNRLEINISDFKLDGDFEAQIIDKLKSYLSPYNRQELINTYPEFKKLQSNSPFPKLDSKFSESDSSHISELFTGINNKTENSIENHHYEIKRHYSSLIHFLKTGSLKWNSLPLTRESLIEILHTIAKNEELWSAFINNQLVYNPQFILRIVNSIGLEEFGKIVITDHIKELKLLTSMIAQASVFQTNSSSSTSFSWSDFQKAVFQTVSKALIRKYKTSVKSIIKELSEDLGKSFSETRRPSFSPALKAVFELKGFVNKLNTQNSASKKFDIGNTRTVTELPDSVNNIEADIQSSTSSDTLEETDLNQLFKSIKNSTNNAPDDNSSSSTFKRKHVESDSLSSFLNEIKKANPGTEINQEIKNNFDSLIKLSKAEIVELLNNSGLEEVEYIIPIDPEGEQEDKTYFIENGGLVILAPYFSHMFKELELKDGSEFVDESAKEKALTLTAYLCFGENEYQEHQLILNKILCGYKPEESINLKLTLTDYEKQIADELIEAAIAHWSTLKNTGIDAFRSTFIKRNGIISSAAEGNWLLRIERTAFDVLLDSLPWPISVHRYSWMNKLLTVEW